MHVDIQCVGHHLFDPEIATSTLMDDDMSIFFCCDNLSTQAITKFRTEFTRGPGRGDTCHLSNWDETLPDLRDYQTTLKDKVGRLCDFSLGS